MKEQLPLDIKSVLEPLLDSMSTYLESEPGRTMRRSSSKYSCISNPSRVQRLSSPVSQSNASNSTPKIQEIIPQSPLMDFGDLPATIPYFPPMHTASMTSKWQPSDPSNGLQPGPQPPLHQRSESNESCPSLILTPTDQLLKRSSRSEVGDVPESVSASREFSHKEPQQTDLRRMRSSVSGLEVVNTPSNLSGGSDLEVVRKESPGLEVHRRPLPRRSTASDPDVLKKGYPGLEVIHRHHTSNGIFYREEYSGLQAVPQHIQGLEVALPRRDSTDQSNPKQGSARKLSRLSGVRINEGNMIFDYRVPSSDYSHLPDAPEKEFLYATYTAVTCLPSEFSQKCPLPSAEWHHLRRDQAELVIAQCPRSDKDLSIAFSQISREIAGRPLPGKQSNSSWREVVFLVQIHRRDLQFFEATLTAMGLWADWEPVRPRLDGGTVLQEYHDKEDGKRWVGRRYTHNVLVQVRQTVPVRQLLNLMHSSIALSASFHTPSRRIKQSFSRAKLEYKYFLAW
jgi:hypothetical protein